MLSIIKDTWSKVNMNTEQLVSQRMTNELTPQMNQSEEIQQPVAPAPVQQQTLSIQLPTLSIKLPSAPIQQITAQNGQVISPVQQITEPTSPVQQAVSPTSQIEVKMNRLDYSTNGQTYYKDEPGLNPTITIKNLPDSWFHYGTTVLRISLALKEDSNKPGGHVTAKQPLKLYENVDRRYNREKQMHMTEFNSFVEVRRQYKETNTYEITLCKAMDLSRKYQCGDIVLPEFAILIYNVKTGETALSDKFVVMSKRQPDKINRNGTAKRTRNGQVRMKRSEQIKSLVASNTQIVSQYRAQQATIEKLTQQNQTMIDLLKQLNKMARLGYRLNNSPNNGVLECFRICLQSVDNMHWMKEQQTNNISALNKRPASSSSSTEQSSKKRRL